MAAMANIVAFDGAATPVSHTLVPISISKENGVTKGVWREELASLPVEAQVSVELTAKTSKQGITFLEVRTNVPVMETAGTGGASTGYVAAPAVAYVDSHVEKFIVHPRSTITSRRLCRQLGVNIGGNISTSVAAQTTGMVPEAFDRLILPT